MEVAMKVLFSIALLVLFPGAGLCQSLNGAQILEQVDRNLQPGDLEMYRKIINIEPDGRKKEFVLWFLKKDKDMSLSTATLRTSNMSKARRALAPEQYEYAIS